MPKQEVIDRAKRDEQEGKSPSTQAGEFVREEMHHVREGKHGAANTKQAIAIGLSKARRAGVELPQPSEGSTSERTRKKAQRDTEKGEEGNPAPSRTRSTSGHQGAETRRPFGGGARKSFASGQKCCAPARPGGAQSFRPTRRCHQRIFRFETIGEKSGSYP